MSRACHLFPRSGRIRLVLCGRAKDGTLSGGLVSWDVKSRGGDRVSGRADDSGDDNADDNLAPPAQQAPGSQRRSKAEQHGCVLLGTRYTGLLQADATGLGQRFIDGCQLAQGFQKSACAFELRVRYASSSRHDRGPCPCVCCI